MSFATIDNRTFFVFQTIMKNEKTAECQFKSRYLGSKDPTNHQAPKSTGENGAPKAGVMEMDVFLAHGATGLPRYLTQNSDVRRVAICLKCDNIGFINKTTNKPWCWNVRCNLTAQNLRIVETSHSHLKIIQTMNSSCFTTQIHV